MRSSKDRKYEVVFLEVVVGVGGRSSGSRYRGRVMLISIYWALGSKGRT